MSFLHLLAPLSARHCAHRIHERPHPTSCPPEIRKVCTKCGIAFDFSSLPLLPLTEIQQLLQYGKFLSAVRALKKSFILSPQPWMTGLAIGALQPGSHSCHMLFQPHCMLTQQSVAWQVCCFSLQDLQKEATLLPISSYCSIFLCWIATQFFYPLPAALSESQSQTTSPMLENENPANSFKPELTKKMPLGHTS